jgi:hypothetical protein
LTDLLWVLARRHILVRAPVEAWRVNAGISLA